MITKVLLNSPRSNLYLILSNQTKSSTAAIRNYFHSSSYSPSKKKFALDDLKRQINSHNHPSTKVLLKSKNYSTLTTTTNTTKTTIEKNEKSFLIEENEFDEEIEKELRKLPALKAQETRRRLRNERRAESSGHALSRQDTLIIPYIPPYEGPDPNHKKGLWTHLKIGCKKNQLKEAWGQWLGARQARKNVESILSPGNKNWENDFKVEALNSIILSHKLLTSGNFEDSRVKKFLHPQMITYIKSKRENLLKAYNSSYTITWKKHDKNLGTQTSSKEKDDSKKAKKKEEDEEELEIVTMRAAPIDRGNTIVQIAVRFKTLQSIEIRDERGFLIFGSHSNPNPTIEYFVFQRRMGQIGNPFLLLTKVEESVKPDCLPV